jgi:Fe-S oxidoreductase/nitrate reductase gamma subunit
MLDSIDMLVLALGLAVFGVGFFRRVMRWKVSAPTPLPNEPLRRVWETLRDAVAHVRILRDPVPGLMHLAIFLGFAAPLTAVALSFLGVELPSFLSLPLSLLLDLVGVLALVAVGYAVVRRYILRPDTIDRKAEDALLLSLIAAILLTGFLLEGFRMARTGASPLWSPVGFLAGQLISAVTDDAARGTGLMRYAWRIHGALVLTTFALVPYTRLWHIVASPLNMLLASRRGPGVAVPIDLEDDDAETFGFSRIDQYPFKDILDLDACTRCGRCEKGCPAYLTDKPLRPRALIQDMRDAWVSWSARYYAGEDPDDENTELIDTVVTRDVLWACTNCRYCEEHCPVIIRHVDKLMELRRHLVLMESDFPGELKDTFKNIENNGNPWGMGFAYRADWKGDADVSVLAEGEEAEILYWAGCAGSFDDRNKRISLAMTKILNAAGVTWGILGPHESCCGDPARKTGNEYLFQMQAVKNIEALGARTFKRIVTACPHCFNMLLHEYPQFGGKYEVISHAQYLDELLTSGRLSLTAGESTFSRICYHDSCFLGRYNGVYEEPRRVLHRAVPSAKLVEADRSRDKSFCCGAGGGRMWMEETLGTRINNARFEQMAAKGPDLLATACPFCLTMLDDARKDLGRAEEIKALDIAEIVADLLP